MGATISTARWLAPASFLIDFAAQQYGIFSSPNMLDVHKANLSFFSPQPIFIAGFFFPQQILQLTWLYRLCFKLDEKKPEERRELEEIADYVPYYAIGNLSIAAWMIFWNASDLKTAQALVTLNTFTQLYYMIARLQPLNTRSTSSILTHAVNKTFAGIGVLDFLHNGSVAFFKDQPASLLVRVLTGVGFGLGSAASDWIFGGCLVYDLVALAVGQSGSWRTLLGAYAVGAGAIVAAKNWVRPPYNRGDKSYSRIEGGDNEGGSAPV